MHRRGFLSLCAAGSLAGCPLLGSSNHEFARVEATAVTDSSEEPYRQSRTLDFELPSGDFATLRLSLQETETLAVELTVVQGLIDFWTVAEENFEAYENGEDVRAKQELSASGVVGGATLVGDIEPGDYRIVLDNTPAFGAEPDGTAAGQVRVVRRVMPASFFDFRETLEQNDIEHEAVGASEDRAWWLVRYQQDEDQSQREAALGVQDILLAYSGVVPAEDDTPDHSGLRVVVERPDADPVLVQASASLARRHSEGELDDQEYFEEVQRTVRSGSE